MSRLARLARRLADALERRARGTAPPLDALRDLPRRPVGRVLVTGAAGQVATLLRPYLASRYRAVRLTDARAVAGLRPNEEFVRADLASRRSLGAAVAGCDAVVHLGAVAKEAAVTRLASANVVGVEHLLALAVEHRVRRVALASTQHVLGMYERAAPLPSDAPPRPDGAYASSKLFAEALARVYADKYGLEVACLRLGSVAPRPEDAEPGAWIGAEDLATLVVTMLEHPGVRYEIVNAVAPHAGDDLGQEELACRLGFTWRGGAPTYAEALARAATHFARDPVALRLRGGVFASATRPMI